MLQNFKKVLASMLALTLLCMGWPSTMTLAAESTGKIIHVAGENVGSDTGDGTEKAPYRTLDKALQNLQAGDTVIIHKGVYQKKDSTTMTAVGTAQNPITIQGCTDPNCPICAHHKELPGAVFTSKTNWKDSSEKTTCDYFLKLLECSYVTIDHLYVTGYKGAGFWPNKSDHVTISNMNIWDIDTPEESSSGVEGVLVNDTTNSTFKNLNIWDIGQTRRSQGDHGIYVGRAENCTFENVKVQDAPGSGIQFYSGENYDLHAKNCVIKNSVFSGCKYGLILVDVDGFLITNNTFYNSGNTDVYMDWTTTNNTIQNNLFYNDRTELYTDPQYGQDAPAIVGFQWCSVKPNSSEKTVKNNTFLNNIYDYCGAFKPIARYCTATADGKGMELAPYAIDEFAAMQNKAPENNKFTNMTAGKANILASIDTKDLPKGDAYESRIRKNADQLFNDVLNIGAGSACINAGVSHQAPSIDSFGNPRDAQVDVGAYEYQNADVKPGTGHLATDLASEDSPEVPFSDIADHWAKDAILSVAKQGIISGYLDGTVKPNQSTTRAEFVAMVVRMLGLDTADKNSQFTDVKSSDWYAGVLAAGVKAQLVNGVSKTSFAPNKSITREEAMVIISNVLTYLKAPVQEDKSVLDDFKDVDHISSWAMKAMVNLIDYGVVSGSNGYLNPKNEITRAEVCTMIDKVNTFVDGMEED